jgi:hypothetical protein
MCAQRLTPSHAAESFEDDSSIDTLIPVVSPLQTSFSSG